MRTWILPAAVAGGLLAGAVGAGIYGHVDHGTPRAAGAQTSTPTVPPPASSSSTPRTITVSGLGSVSGKPDLLSINLGVQVENASATAALQDASNRTAALIATLKKAGVADVDITTTDVNLYPRFDTAGQHIVAYQSSNTVQAKLRDLTKAGAVIDAAAGTVGDAIRLNGLSFSIENTGPLYAQARDLAVKQAQAQAEQLAKAAGVVLGPVMSISEVSQQYNPPVPYAASAAAGAKDSAVPIQPGSQTLQLSVNLVYAIGA